MEDFGSVSHMFSDELSPETSVGISRRTLTLTERITVLKKYDKNPNVKQLAEQFDCGKSQIRNIIRHADQYHALWLKCKDGSRVRRPQDPFLIAVGIILFEWVERALCYQINITDNMLRSVGQEIADHLKYQDFKSNNRWLSRFKQKFKLFDLDKLNAIPGDAGSRDRKRLDIAVIIDDIRREHGHGKIPTLAHKETTSSGLSYSNLSEWEETVQTIASESSCSMQDDDEQIVENTCDNELNGQGGEAYIDDGTGEDAKEIENYKEALNHLGPLEHFVLFKENIRAVGLINQLENLFRDEIMKDE